MRLDPLELAEIRQKERRLGNTYLDEMEIKLDKLE